MLLNEIINEVGMTKRAVKYYEEKGLLSVDKDNNGYRNYTAQDVETLKKISVYRKLGISIKDIQSLLETGDKSILLRIYQEKVQEKVLKDSELEALGMKQRLGIAMALLGEPELLILDEPTNGLDPIGIEELRELIRSFPEQGITVILSSHILSEVQLLADKVGIISGGILGYEGALKQGDNLEDLFMNVVRKNQKAGEIHG